MKIDEIMVEASVDRKQFGKETVRANQKANIARSAAFRAQMDAPSAAPEPAEATPTATPAATPNYGAGGAGTPQIQATPISKVSGKPAGVTPAAGPATLGATPNKDVTLANPISSPAATPSAATTAKPAAGAAAAAAGGTQDASEPAIKGRSRFPNLTRIGTGLGMVAHGIGGALGSTLNTVNKGWQAGDGSKKNGSLAQIQDTSGRGTPDIPARPGATSPTAAVAAPAATPAGAKAPAAPAGSPDLGAKAPVGASPDLGAKPGQPGAAEPGKPGVQDSPIAKPGEEKPGAAEPAKPAAEPAAAKAPATAQAPSAQGKTMSKQEILSWISRNDEDNASLQALKDAIAAAETTGAPAAAPAAATPNYGQAGAGIQNTQAAPGKVSYAPKTAAPAATPNYAPKGVVTATPKQPQMASKQYKKAPL